jgi:hypothetical protein
MRSGHYSSRSPSRGPSSSTTTRTSSPRKNSSGVTKIRQEYLLRWLNGLGLGNKITERDWPEACKSGVLPGKLLQFLDTNVSLPGFFRKPLAKKACIHNIELVLTDVWKKSPNPQLMPSSEEVFLGKTDKVWTLLNGIFELYVMQELRNKTREILNWMQKILSIYGRRLQPSTLNTPFTTLSQDLISCTSIACILNSLLEERMRPDMKQVYWQTENSTELNSNVSYVFSVMQKARIPIFFTVDEWISRMDSDFLLLQVSLIYRFLKDKEMLVTDARRVLYKDQERLKAKFSEPSSIFSNSSLISMEMGSLNYSASMTYSPSMTYSASTIKPLVDSREPSRESSTASIIPPGAFSSLTFGKDKLASLFRNDLSPVKEMYIGFENENKEENSTTDPSMSPGDSSGRSVSPGPTFTLDETPTRRYGRGINRDKKIMLEERKQMYTADQRRKAESGPKIRAPVLRSLKLNLNAVPQFHIQNPKYSSPKDQLSTDSVFCFLLTPRILKLTVNESDEAMPYIFNIVPNEKIFSLKREEYYFEWRESFSMRVVGSLDISQIQEISHKNERFLIKYPTFPETLDILTIYKIECTHPLEAQRYCDGLNYLLKQSRSSINSPRM